MHYKTMTLELIKQRPQLHEHLRASKTLLATMERYALMLKASHEAWMAHLNETLPGSGRSQLSSEAIDIAVKELEHHLGSTSTHQEDEFSLDVAMAYIQLHTPSE
jgi:hypothetical protein